MTDQSTIRAASSPTIKIKNKLRFKSPRSKKINDEIKSKIVARAGSLPEVPQRAKSKPKARPKLSPRPTSRPRFISKPGSSPHIIPPVKSLPPKPRPKHRPQIQSPRSQEEYNKLLAILNQVFAQLPVVSDIIAQNGYIWGEFLSWLVSRIIHLNFNIPEIDSIIDHLSKSPIKCWLKLNDFNEQPLTIISRIVIKLGGTIEWLPSYDQIFAECNLQSFAAQFPIAILEDTPGALLLPAGSYLINLPVEFDQSLGQSKPLPKIPPSDIDLPNPPSITTILPRQMKQDDSTYKTKIIRRITYHLVHSMDLLSPCEYSVDGLAYSKIGLRSRFPDVQMQSICSDTMNKNLIPHPIDFDLDINEAIQRLRDPTIIKFLDLYSLIKTIKRGLQLYKQGYRAKENSHIFAELTEMYQRLNLVTENQSADYPSLLKIKHNQSNQDNSIIKAANYTIRPINSAYFEEKDLTTILKKLGSV